MRNSSRTGGQSNRNLPLSNWMLELDAGEGPEIHLNLSSTPTPASNSPSAPASKRSTTPTPRSLALPPYTRIPAPSRAATYFSPGARAAPARTSLLPNTHAGPFFLGRWRSCQGGCVSPARLAFPSFRRRVCVAVIRGTASRRRLRRKPLFPSVLGVLCFVVATYSGRVGRATVEFRRCSRDSKLLRRGVYDSVALAPRPHPPPPRARRVILSFSLNFCGTVLVCFYFLGNHVQQNVYQLPILPVVS